MASGCAVVASRTGAWEDIIEENVHGKLVPCNDTKSAHKALKELTEKYLIWKRWELMAEISRTLYN